MVDIVIMLPVDNLKLIKPREPVELIPAGFVSHHISPRLMICEINTPDRRKIKGTSGSSDSWVEVVFCILGISVHRDLDLAIKACHLDCVFIED